MRTHELKTWAKFYERILDGSKQFEIRYNDRAFQTGDRLKLVEIADNEDVPTGRYIFCDVTFMTHFAQKENYVVMGIKFSNCEQPDCNS